MREHVLRKKSRSRHEFRVSWNLVLGLLALTVLCHRFFSDLNFQSSIVECVLMRFSLFLDRMSTNRTARSRVDNLLPRKDASVTSIPKYIILSLEGAETE